MFRATIARAKDAALEKALAMAIRPRIERYGELTEINLDTANQVLSAELMLTGESTPLIISQARYRVEEDADQSWVVFHSIKVSRPWAQNVLDDHFPEIRLKLPDFLKGLIS